MSRETIYNFGYVLDLENDVVVLTTKEKMSVPDAMFLMLKHGAIDCRVYETNGSDCMEEWKLLTTYCGLMTSF